MDRLIWQIARLSALAGGVVLLALVGMICASVLGNATLKLAQMAWVQSTLPGLAEGMRAAGIGPIRASYELVEIGVAFVIFAFLPWVQITRGHAMVEVFTARLPARADAALAALWEVLMAAAMVLIAWRLYAGMLGKVKNAETTFLMQIPLWWAYAACLVAACLAALVTLWATVAALRRAARAWA